MIVYGIVILVVSISSTSAYKIHMKNLGKHRIKPGEPHPLRMNDVQFSNDYPNVMMRRKENEDIALVQLGDSSSSEELPYVKHGPSNHLSSQIQKILLALNSKAQQTKQRKILNLEELDRDRHASKKSSLKKIQFVQSLEPPTIFFNKLAQKVGGTQKIQASDNSDQQLSDIINLLLKHENMPLKVAKVLNKKEKNNEKWVHDEVQKSLENGDSLEDLLALNAPSLRQKKKALGFSVVNLGDFERDMEQNGKSNFKGISLVQSVVSPEKYWKNVLAVGLDSSERKLDWNRWVSNLSKHDNIKAEKSIFNEDGMLYLTKPKDSEARKLAALINKVMRVQDKQGKHGSLRQLEKEFSDDELKHLRLIANSIDEESREVQREPDELDQLLQREQHLMQNRPNVFEERPQNYDESKPLRIHEDKNENQYNQKSQSYHLNNIDLSKLLPFVDQILEQQANEADQITSLNLYNSDEDNTLQKSHVYGKNSKKKEVGSKIKLHHNHNNEKERSELNKIQNKEGLRQRGKETQRVNPQFNFEDLLA